MRQPQRPNNTKKKREACKQENHRRDRDHEQTDNTEKDNCWPEL